MPLVCCCILYPSNPTRLPFTHLSCASVFPASVFPSFSCVVFLDTFVDLADISWALTTLFFKAAMSMQTGGVLEAASTSSATGVFFGDEVLGRFSARLLIVLRRDLRATRSSLDMPCKIKMEECNFFGNTHTHTHTVIYDISNSHLRERIWPNAYLTVWSACMLSGGGPRCRDQLHSFGSMSRRRSQVVCTAFLCSLERTDRVQSMQKRKSF